MSTVVSSRASSDQSRGQLHCDLVPDRDVVTVVATGELDLATIGQLDDSLRELHAVGFLDLRIDLRGLEFIDVAGVNLLARWRQLADLEPFHLRIDGAHGPVLRAIRLVRMEPVLRRTGP